MRTEAQTSFPTEGSLSAFSTLNLLKNYNQLFLPPGNNRVQIYHNYPCGTAIGNLPQENFSFSPALPFSPLIQALHPYTHYPLPAAPDLKSINIYGRRPRGEKKPIPDDQKDDRYYERRKRNNQAAKKSRDARKFREDQVALRATLLEHENAILRAQLLALREEAEALRQVLISQKKHFLEPSTKESKGKILEFDKKWEPDFEFHAAEDLK